jgi:hypothetical protein
MPRRTSQLSPKRRVSGILWPFDLVAADLDAARALVWKTNFSVAFSNLGAIAVPCKTACETCFVD